MYISDEYLNKLPKISLYERVFYDILTYERSNKAGSVISHVHECMEKESFTCIFNKSIKFRP